MEQIELHHSKWPVFRVTNTCTELTGSSPLSRTQQVLFQTSSYAAALNHWNTIGISTAKQGVAQPSLNLF